MTHLQRWLRKNDLSIRIRDVGRALDNIWLRMRFTGANLHFTVIDVYSITRCCKTLFPKFC